MPRKATKSGEKKPTIVKKIPTSENGAGVQCRTKSGMEYQITQCLEKQRHTLWKVVSEGYEKISTAESPHDLYALIDWNK